MIFTICAIPLPSPLPLDNRAILPLDNRAILPLDNRAILPLDNRAILPLDNRAILPYSFRMLEHNFFAQPPRVLAHRGDSEFYPENTLPAFISAEKLKVDVIETDVHLTADNDVVIWHDKTLDRQTNGTGIVEVLTLKQLQMLDAGYYYTKDNGETFPFRGTGVTLMSLDEALETLPDMRFNIDLKTKDSQLPVKFAEIVGKHNAMDRILGASFHTENLQALRSLMPGMATSFSTYEVFTLFLKQKFGFRPSSREKLKGQVLQVPERYGILKVLTDRFMQSFHDAGLYIHVWTINNEADMRRLIRMGADAIFTDNPRLLQKVYADLALINSP